MSRVTRGNLIDELTSDITVQVTANIKDLRNMAQDEGFGDLETVADKLERNLERFKEQVLVKLGDELLRFIQQNIKSFGLIDTGNMLNSVTRRSMGSDRVQVGLNAITTDGYPYPLGIELGTSPHVIEGNPWLYWKGARHPVRRVNHPGTKPWHFVQIAQNQWKAGVTNLVQTAAKNMGVID